MERASPMTQEQAAVQVLEGLSILVVEDEYYLASDLAAQLERAGASIVGPAGDCENAIRLIETASPDFAVIDMNLGGVMAFPVVEALKERGIPFIVATGYSATVLGEPFSGHPQIEKPYQASDLMRLIQSIAAESPRSNSC